MDQEHVDCGCDSCTPETDHYDELVVAAQDVFDHYINQDEQQPLIKRLGDCLEAVCKLPSTGESITK